jgi:hypothetical protein
MEECKMPKRSGKSVSANLRDGDRSLLDSADCMYAIMPLAIVFGRTIQSTGRRFDEFEGPFISLFVRMFRPTLFLHSGNLVVIHPLPPER